MVLTAAFLAAVGCAAPEPVIEPVAEIVVVEPLTHPPQYSFGDLVTVGKEGDVVGYIVEISYDGHNNITNWQYEVMFENNRRLSYKQNEIRLYRKMDWNVAKIDKILLNEPPVEPDNAEIENEDAIP